MCPYGTAHVLQDAEGFVSLVGSNKQAIKCWLGRSLEICPSHTLCVTGVEQFACANASTSRKSSASLYPCFRLPVETIPNLNLPINLDNVDPLGAEKPAGSPVSPERPLSPGVVALPPSPEPRRKRMPPMPLDPDEIFPFVSPPRTPNKSPVYPEVCPRQSVYGQFLPVFCTIRKRERKRERECISIPLLQGRVIFRRITF